MAQAGRPAPTFAANFYLRPGSDPQCHALLKNFLGSILAILIVDFGRAESLYEKGFSGGFAKSETSFSE
jgi:hypothetical protein